MLSAIEVSISGDIFLLANDMSSQQLEQVKLLSELFRKDKKASGQYDSYSVFHLFSSEVEQQLGINLNPITISSVITLK